MENVTLVMLLLKALQVLAEYHLKLVETEQSLAAESLHEVLVGIGTVESLRKYWRQLWGQQHVEERGLEDAALAHEDEYHLVHHLQRSPQFTTIATSHFLKK